MEGQTGPATMARERIAGRVELLLADAQAALDAGDAAEAKALARAVLALDPDNARAESVVGNTDQRIQVTLMFCDLVGSTPLADGCDPEEMAAILREYRRLCMSAIGRYGGFVEDRKGDGLLARFGYPVAHEDDARRAVLSGLEVVRAIRAHPRGLQVRIAVHTGLVVLDGAEVVGATPNEAARLQGLAPPDTVVISETTHALVRNHFDVRSRGRATLRGVARPIEVFTVIGESSADALDLADTTTPFTGRDAELAVVRELWDRACLKPARALVDAPAALLISGLAGIGKSRTARESVLELGARCLTGGCSSYHTTTSLHPFVGLLQTVCAIAPHDDSLARLAKLRARMAQVHPGSGGDLPVLTAALSIPADETSPMTGVDAKKLRALALRAAADLLRSAAAEGPVIVLIEDLHWADESSLELISVLLDAPCPGLLLLMTARPDFDPPWPAELVPRLALEPLPAADLQRMTRRIADGAELDDAYRRELIARSDGIPLYLEELVRSGTAQRGQAEAGGTLLEDASRIPPALRDPMLARLVLPGVDLELVQTAATIGRDVDEALLQRACRLADKPFASKLANVVAAGLLDPVGDGAVRFRHDLLRDAAYETQRRSVCRERHAQIADLLRDGEQAASTAFHLERAERFAEAIEALLAQARADQALGAHRDALAKLTRVLALLERLPEATRLVDELTARHLRSLSATTIWGYAPPETAQDHARCVELCEQLGHTPDLIPSLMLSWSYYLFRGEIAEAGHVCDTLQRRAAEPALPARTAALALSTLGVQRFVRGHFDDADRILRAFLRHPDWQSDELPERWPMPHHPASSNSAHLIVIMAIQGRYEEAVALGDKAARRAEHLPFPYGPFSLAFVTDQTAVAHLVEGAYTLAGRLGAKAEQLGDRHGFELWSIGGAMHRLAAAAHLGDAAAADELAAVVGRFRGELTCEFFGAYALTELGAAQIAVGRLVEARASLDEALRVASATGSVFYSAKTLRERGSLRVSEGDSGGLEDLVAAVELARAQGATGLERRALEALERHGAPRPAAR